VNPDRTQPVGQPEMFHMDLKPFWVDRDTTIQHSEVGQLWGDQLQRLPLVERLEIEFRYE
jgi:hypothetical protein